MDMKIMVTQAGRRLPESSAASKTLHNVKSIEEAQEWAAKTVKNLIPANVAQLALDAPQGKRSRRA